MNCERVLTELSSYSAGCLQGEARARVAEHLAACADCRAELESYRALDGLLGRETAVADERLVTGVMQEVQVLGAPERPGWLWAAEQAAPLMVLAAVIPLLTLLILSAVQGPLGPSTAALPNSVAYSSGIATGMTLGLCGMASLAAAWASWRAANSAA